MHWSLSATAATPFLDAKISALLHAYEAAGLIFVASDSGPGTSDGGTQEIGATRLVRTARTMRSTTPAACSPRVACSCRSTASAASSSDILARRELGGIAGAISVCPSTDFAPLLPHATYGPLIRAAYGATSDADFWPKVVGYNPIAHPAAALRGVPQLFIGATDDTVVPIGAHIAPIVDKLAGWTLATVYTGTGGHLAAALYNDNAANIVAFINAVRGS
jgi:hypothetical protein